MSGYLYLLILVTLSCYHCLYAQRLWTTDELENHINPEDLKEFLKVHSKNVTTTTEPNFGGASLDASTQSNNLEVPENVDCFGIGSLVGQYQWLFNMQPDPSDKINTHFYFSSRNMPKRVQVYPGEQFGLEWVDFKPTRKTVMIVHGFMSYSNASWVTEMTDAFLKVDDVNVISVDWSGGGNTWKYWRAVANTRRVGSDVTRFMKQLMNHTGASPKEFHFIGHSLGAHICSYVSYHIGRVSRITGLDPAQPCFRTTDRIELLDDSDADYVDVIHTNGRMLSKFGLGIPEPMGDADFYPNGGMNQPGCRNSTRTIWTRFISSFIRLNQAICSHGRAYLLFTESLLNNNCSFTAHRWNLTYEGVNSSLEAACKRDASCSEMGIHAIGSNGLPKAFGSYFVLTTDKIPYCPSDEQRRYPFIELLKDLKAGFSLMKKKPNVTIVNEEYADPMMREDVETTTTKSWFQKWFG